MCLSSLALSDSVRACGAEGLSLWARMKQRDGLAAADGGELRAILEVILAAAEVKHSTPIPKHPKSKSHLRLCLQLSKFRSQ